MSKFPDKPGDAQVFHIGLGCQHEQSPFFLIETDGEIIYQDRINGIDSGAVREGRQNLPPKIITSIVAAIRNRLRTTKQENPLGQWIIEPMPEGFSGNTSNIQSLAENLPDDATPDEIIDEIEKRRLEVIPAHVNTRNQIDEAIGFIIFNERRKKQGKSTIPFGPFQAEE